MTPGKDDWKYWEVDDWWEDIEDGVWPYSDEFLEKMKAVPMYAKIWKERQRQAIIDRLLRDATQP